MSETTATTAPASTQAPTTPKAKKVFTKANLKKVVHVKVHLPRLYPDFEPWGFKLRLRLSAEAEERRAVFNALAPKKQTQKAYEQTLDELCDLLTDLPTGFGDLTEVVGAGPGASFKAYVESADPTEREVLNQIVDGALALYMRHVSPQEFRPEV